MGKYTIQQHWPSDLKILAATVTRAKLERKWRKRNVLTFDDAEGGSLKYCIDRYMEADTALREAKARFDDLYYDYKQIGEV